MQDKWYNLNAEIIDVSERNSWQMAVQNRTCHSTHDAHAGPDLDLQ